MYKAGAISFVSLFLSPSISSRFLYGFVSLKPRKSEPDQQLSVPSAAHR